MKYLSVCSGIEAATVAWHSLGWQAAAYSEIEPFPSAVLAHHYPDIPNVGDMTKYKEWNIEPESIDLLVGGTPCQSFSVAGLRKGLADPRGNLALVYCGILDHLKPRWFVWENVPGVLSSGGGRDFGSFLGAVAELGYGFAYRVLDAQYFGVAQRRRRVFVVGHLGDWRPAAKVLFERESLRGDPAPSREAGKAVAGGSAPGSGNGVGFTHCHAIAPTLNAAFGKKLGLEDQHINGGAGLFVAGVTHSLRGEGFDASEDGTGRGTPLVPVTFHPTQDPISSTDVCHSIGDNENATAAVAIAWDEELNASVEQAGTLLRGGDGGRHDGVLAPTLTASNDPSRSPQSSEITAQVAAVVQATAAVAYRVHGEHSTAMTGGGVARVADPVEIARCLDSSGGYATNQGGNVVHQFMQVRRLTPVECERLQGFPDDYTAIPWRGKADTPDGPRYKALGNSMAVPVMAWIGKRIQQQEA